MTTGERKQKPGDFVAQSLLAAGIGVGVTLLLFVLCAVGIFRGSVTEEGERLCIAISVLLGSFAASLRYTRAIRTGFVIQTAVITLEFLLLVIIISAFRPQGSIIGGNFAVILFSSAVGSAAGAWPKLDKKHKNGRYRRRRYNK